MEYSTLNGLTTITLTVLLPGRSQHTLQKTPQQLGNNLLSGSQ